MSITRMKYGELEYYKVARAWNKLERQEYVRIRKDEDKAYQEAVKLDAKFADSQWAYNELTKMSGEAYFNENGTIIGLGNGIDHKSGRPILKLRIQTSFRKQPYMTSISIEFHGFDKAFQLAIDKICKWHKLAEDHNARSMMLEAKAHYQADKKQTNAELVDFEQAVEAASSAEVKQAINEMDELEKSLLAEIEDFNQRRHVIRG